MRRHGHASVAAFTLIELLAVLVVVSIIVAVAVLSIGDRRGNEAVAAEARRLAALAELARERAELESVEYGLEVRTDGYRFLQYDELDGTWHPSQRPVLRPRTLPPDMRMALQVVAQSLPAGAARDEGSAKQATQPGVLLLSSGEVSNFRVVLTSSAKGAAAWAVGSDGASPVQAAKLADGP